MKFINSKLSDQIIESHKLKVGNFYFLKDMIIAEIGEGEHIDFNSSLEYTELIIDFYGNTEPFGYICNRVNNFSISPLDYPKFNSLLENLAIYGIVHSNHFDRSNFEVEKRFCNKPFKSFSDLEAAYKQLKIFLKKPELVQHNY